MVRLMAIDPRALEIYILCYGHSLNLACQDIIRGSSTLRMH